MTRPIIVIDDDLVLVAELIGYLSRHAPSMSALGPPDLFLDLSDIREKSANAAAVIVDLRIGGSATYGRSIMRKMCKTWEKFDTPVIVWSKYLCDTILFEPGRIVRIDLIDDGGSVMQEIDHARYAALPDAARIDDLRRVCRGARAFVTKAVSDPVAVLFQVLHRSGVIPRELLTLH
ncbi:MAG: hypothetical protein AABO58_25355 [Acidobacteriota bacterium]